MSTLTSLINIVTVFFIFFFFNDTATTEIYTLSLHDALPISYASRARCRRAGAPHRRNRLASRRRPPSGIARRERSEEHTSELQSQSNLVCRLLLEKKKKKNKTDTIKKIKSKLYSQSSTDTPK